MEAACAWPASFIYMSANLLGRNQTNLKPMDKLIFLPSDVDLTRSPLRGHGLPETFVPGRLQSRPYALGGWTAFAHGPRRGGPARARVGRGGPLHPLARREVRHAGLSGGDAGHVRPTGVRFSRQREYHDRADVYLVAAARYPECRRDDGGGGPLRPGCRAARSMPSLRRRGSSHQ